MTTNNNTGPQTDRSTFRQLIPFLVLALVGTILVAGFIHDLERKNVETEFRELAEQKIATVRSNIAVTLDIVDLVAGHFAVAPEQSTSRDGFARMLAPLIERYRFIQGISWDPLVKPQEIPAYEAAARRDGLANFIVYERSREGAVVPVAPRTEHSPVYFMEPRTGNEAAIGFDLASNPIRKAALDAARDSGKSKVTGRITLVQEKGKQYGVLILGPVYRGGHAGDAQERRDNLIGHISGVYRLGDLIDSTASSTERAAGSKFLRVFLLDLAAEDKDRLLHPFGAEVTREGLLSGMHLEESFEMAGRQWQLIVAPTNEFKAARQPFLWIAALGVALAASTGLYFYLKGRIDAMTAAVVGARKLRKVRDHLELTQSLAEVASFRFGRLDGTVEIDERAAAMLGLDPKDGEMSLEGILARVSSSEIEHIARALRSAKDADLEFIVDRPDGARTIQARTHNRIDDESVRTTVALQDVTSRRAAEAERLSMIRAMAESSRFESLGVLAAGIAHEINTPLQYVSSNLSFLGDEIPPLVDAVGVLQRGGDAAPPAPGPSVDVDFLKIEVPAAIKQMQDGLTRITEIVQAVKDFAHPSNKEMARNDINDIVRRSVTISRNYWKHAANLHFDLAANLPMVDCIASEIGQVVVNLISNAADAVEDAGRVGTTGRIDVSSRAVGESVEIVVRDNGCGIPKSIKDRVFDPFFTTKAPGRGTGQGLSIVRTIVVGTHKGTIDLESEVGVGTTISIRLPLRAEREPAVGAANVA